jgi:predicted transglutaminase-like cysteine proteinase
MLFLSKRGWVNMFSRKLYAFASLTALSFASACASTQTYSSNQIERSGLAAQRGAQMDQNASVKAAPWLTPSSQNVPVARVEAASPPPRAVVRRIASRGTAMGQGQRYAPPEGLYDFCERAAVDCGAMVSSAPTRGNNGFMLASYGGAARTQTVAMPSARPLAAIEWTSANRQLVSDINRNINRAMIGTTDVQAFGRNEYWAMPISNPDRPRGRGRPLGDCEDFALEKRKALIEAGIPVESLYLAVAMSPRIGLHAVLVIATDEGDFVLDNMNEWVTEWSKTGYTWIKRQASTSMLDWVLAGDQVTPLQAAPKDEPNFIQENPIILASAQPVPAQPTASFVLASLSPDTTARSDQQVLGLRGFSSGMQPAFVSEGRSTSSVAEVAKTPKQIYALAQQIKLASLETAKLGKLTGKELYQAQNRITVPTAAPVLTASMPFAPGAQVAANAPPSNQAMAGLRLTIASAKLPEQAVWYVDTSGQMVALQPQRLELLAAFDVVLKMPTTRLMASLY